MQGTGLCQQDRSDPKFHFLLLQDHEIMKFSHHTLAAWYHLHAQNHSESLGTRFVLWNTPADQAPEPLLPRPDEWKLCWFFVMIHYDRIGSRVSRASKKTDQLGTSTWNVFHRPALHYVAVGCEVVSRALEKDSCKCCDDCIQRGSDPTMCSKCINALRCPKNNEVPKQQLEIWSQHQ